MTRLAFWGVDGCRAGWCCCGVSADGKDGALVLAATMDEAWTHLRPHKPRLILTDMPLGLPRTGAERACDRLARKFVGARRTSIFPMPCAQAMQVVQRARAPQDKQKLFARAKARHKKITGRGLSVQSLNILPSIAEMDAFARTHHGARLREMHPEVAFTGLNRGRACAHYKKTPAGASERLRLVRRHLPRLAQLYRDSCPRFPRAQLAPDDILDASVGALTGWLSQHHKLRRLHEPQAGAPLMEIVYVRPDL